MTVVKPVAIKTLFFALIVTFCAAISASAQNAKLQIDHLDRLFPRAAETVDVRVESSLLLIAAKFLKSDNPDEALVKELISALKGVYVKGVEFDKEGEFSEADVEPIRTQLRAPGWDRIVGVRSRRDGQNVEVYLMIEGGVIAGIGVLVFDLKQLFVVNVVGPLDPEKITQLRGHFGIPKDLDFDWSGAKRNRKGERGSGSGEAGERELR
ncbi:MAG: DUF4252 domain-containing protein [Acidobacteria bacterium]|nr:DUF4252 domain-containing protein [Acidobacteriota bacterium]